jgi:hypothetical protein
MHVVMMVSSGHCKNNSTDRFQTGLTAAGALVAAVAYIRMKGQWIEPRVKALPT